MTERHHDKESKAQQAHQVLENFIDGYIDQTSAIAHLNTLYPELTTSFTPVTEGDGGPLEDLLSNANAQTPIDDLELGILELRRQAHAKNHIPKSVRAGRHKAAALVAGLLTATLGGEVARTDNATAQKEYSERMDTMRKDVDTVLAMPRPKADSEELVAAKSFTHLLNGSETFEDANDTRVILEKRLKKIDPSINIATLQDEISLRSYLTSGLEAVLKNDALMALHAGLISLSALFAAALYLYRSSPSNTPAGATELFASFVELLNGELYSIEPKRISKITKQIFRESSSGETALKALFPSTSPNQAQRIQENDTNLETILDSRKSPLTKGLEGGLAWAQSLFTRKTPAITGEEANPAEENSTTDKPLGLWEKGSAFLRLKLGEKAARRFLETIYGKNTHRLRIIAIGKDDSIEAEIDTKDRHWYSGIFSPSTGKLRQGTYASPENEMELKGTFDEETDLLTQGKAKFNDGKPDIDISLGDEAISTANGLKITYPAASTPEDEPTDKIPAPKTLSSTKRLFYSVLTGLGMGGAVVNEVKAISETYESVNVRGAKVTATDLNLASHHLGSTVLGTASAIFLRGLLKENSEKKVKLFEKLFPKSLLGFGERKLDIQQGESGTCYFLSALIAIWEKDQALFETMIEDLIKETEDPDVVEITFPSDSKGNAISNTYKVCLDPNRVCEGELLSINRLASITDDQGNDISRALTRAPLGVKALEAAIASHMSRVEQGRNIGMTMRVAPDRRNVEMADPTPVDGGYPEEVFQILLGKAIEKREYKDSASYNLTDLNAANVLAVAATLSQKRASKDQKRAMRALRLHTSHAYAVKSYDAEAHTVNLINPHNSTQSIVISEDNFKKYFSHIFEGTLTPKD